VQQFYHATAQELVM